MNTNKFVKFVITATLAVALTFSAAPHLDAATVSYNFSTGNFTTRTQNTGLGGNGDPFAGAYNPDNKTTEIAQYANSTWEPEVAVASFRTLTDAATGGAARSLQVGDVFTITAYIASNPNSGGTIGISFNDGTASSSFSNYNSGSKAQFVIYDGGAWKVNSNSGVNEASGLGSGSDRTFTIKITSDRTFNATIGNQNFYDLTFSGGSAATIDSFAIWSTVGAPPNPWKTDNPNSFWKNPSLENSGTVELGYAAGAGVTRSFSGVIADGLAADSTSTASANSVRIGGDAGSQVNLSGNNTYTGTTTVNANATLEVQHANALGSTAAGTTVTSGGTLKIYSESSLTIAEAVTVNGTGVSGIGGALRNTGGSNTISGNVTLGSNARIAATGGSLGVGGNVVGGNNVLFVGAEENVAISGAISGAGNSQDGTTTSLFKDGAKTLTLSGNNSYTGDTRVIAGRLVVASGGNLGSGSDVFVSDGATLAVDTSTTVASIRETGNGNGGEVAIGSGATLTINGADKGTLFQDTISGAGNLAVNGSGTTSLSLYGTQSWSGTTTVSGGKLSTGVALASSGVTVNGGTFETSAADILGSGASVAISSGTYALGGNDTVGSFSISGGALSGSSTLTASTYALNGGTVTASLGAGTATASTGTTTLDGTLGATTVNVSGGTVNLGANDRLANGATVNVSSGALGMGTRTDTVGTLNMSGGSVTGSTGNKLTAATYNLTGGTIGANLGAGTLNANSGAATLNGTADAATVNVGGGALTLGSAARLFTNAAVTVSNSGTLTLGGNETISSLAGTNGTLALGANTLTVSSGNFGSLITGTNGVLIKIGDGTLTLSGVNTYTGGTLLNGGTLDADNSSAFGTGSVTVAATTTLDLLSHNITNLIINNGGTILSTGTVSDVVASNGTTSIGGSDSVVVEASGSATVDVSGSNVTVSNVSGSAVVNVGGTDATVDTVSGGTVTLSNTATGSRVNTASAGTVNANAAGVNVGTVSNTATVNVGGANGRVTTLAGGTVNANAAGLVITNKTGGNLAVSNGVSVALRSGSSAGVISGAGGITKQGATTLTLSGNNTYSGATTVEQGKLIVNGSVANSAVTVQSGATLGGSGTVGSLTLNGILAPGNSADTATSEGNTFWNQGSSYDWEIFDLDGPAGTGWDLLAVTGGELNLNGITTAGGFTINLITLSSNNSTPGSLTNFDPTANYTGASAWMIASATTITGFEAGDFTLNSSGFVGATGTFAIEHRSGEGLFITYSGGSEAIPEPGTWAAAVLLAGAAGYVRWRRRKEQPKDA
jgi:fibronectin-binding autotransporter adhesin